MSKNSSPRSTSDDYDSSDSSSSVEEIERDLDYEAALKAFRLYERSKRIVKVFLKQVQENQEFPRPLQHAECEEDHDNTENMFLDQVRNICGYHVDCLPPRMDPCICPKELSNDFGVSTYVAFLNRSTKCVIDSINAEAQEKGKYFELVRVNKVTEARRAIYLLTLTIKDESNAGKIIQAEVSMREEELVLVCSSCGRNPCPILLWCELIS